MRQIQVYMERITENSVAIVVLFLFINLSEKSYRLL